MNLYYNLKKIGTNATCTLKKIKNKNNYTVSTSHKHICTVNMPHSVPCQQICTIIWGRGVFRKKKVLRGCKSNRKFYRDENRK